MENNFFYNPWTLQKKKKKRIKVKKGFPEVLWIVMVSYSTQGVQPWSVTHRDIVFFRGLHPTVFPEGQAEETFSFYLELFIVLFFSLKLRWGKERKRESAFLRKFITGDSKIIKWCWRFSAQFKGTVRVQTGWNLRLEICSWKLEKKKKKKKNKQLAAVPTADRLISIIIIFENCKNI